MQVHQVSDKPYWEKYLKPCFTFRQAAEAAAFPLNTLRSNYQRGWFQSFGKALNAGRGRAQKLCLGDVLVLAIASRLIDQGERPLNAYNAALPFGVVGTTPKAIIDLGFVRRRPFELFDRSQFDTYLLWRRGSPARVLPVGKGLPVPINDGLDQEGKQFGVATTVLLLNAVEQTVLKQLDVGQSGRPDEN